MNNNFYRAFVYGSHERRWNHNHQYWEEIGESFVERLRKRDEERRKQPPKSYCWTANPNEQPETPGLTRSGHRCHFDVLPDGTALAVTPWTVEDWRKPIYREKQ